MVEKLYKKKGNLLLEPHPVIFVGTSPTVHGRTTRRIESIAIWSLHSLSRCSTNPANIQNQEFVSTVPSITFDQLELNRLKNYDLQSCPTSR